MPEQVVMPRLSDTMTEGTVAKWLKHPGDQVKKGEPLVEIETDKANIELEAYASGTLARITLGEGQSAPVGDLIGEIALPGEPLELATLSQPAASLAATPAAPTLPTPAQKPAPGPRPAAPEVEPGGLRASPLARRLARELGMDLVAVKGTGPAGRIQKEDVEAAARAAKMAAAVPAAVPIRAAPAPPAAPAPEEAQPAAGLLLPTTDVEVIPLNRMQQTIARRMLEAKTTVPHFYVSMEADMQLGVQTLDGLNADQAKEERITINDLILKACALSLKHFPEVNAFYQDGQFYRHKRVHIGLAVSVPGGLLVPVIRDVDKKNLREIALETKRLIQKMREGKAEPADYEGGTFSVSNLGMYGVDVFTAIINPPQSGILAVGAVQDKPVVRDGQLAISKRAMLTLSADHRVFYGATGAEFLADIKSRLEKPLSLVL